MRILQVVKSSLAPGGQNNTVHRLSDALAGRGHEVTVLALRRHPRDRESLLSVEPHAYRAHLVKLPRTRGWLHNLIFTRAVRKLAGAGGYDAVHAHMLYPEGHCALRAVQGSGIPLVVTAHGEDLQIDEACSYGVRRDPRVDARVRRVLDGAGALVAISDAMRRQMIDAGAPPGRIRVIRWGFHLSPPAGDPPERPGYLLSVGRFVPKKGYDLLLRAMRLVADARPEARLLIAGEGPEMEALRHLAAQLRLTDRVAFLGFVTGGALAALYRGARLFVCPSRWEPLGLVNLEAMACGLPVAAFGVDGIPDIVKDGERGLLAAPFDPASLAAAILRLLGDDELRARMSRAATAAAASFRWERVAELHEELYREVVRRGGAARAA